MAEWHPNCVALLPAFLPGLSRDWFESPAGADRITKIIFIMAFGTYIPS